MNLSMTNPETKSTSSLIMPGEVTSTCWSCGTMRAEHFCSACGKVQPPVPVLPPLPPVPEVPPKGQKANKGIKK